MDRARIDIEVKFASDKSGAFSGYGSIFGNVDQGGDVIVKGAFKDTLRAWEDKGKYPPMLLQHGGFLGGAEDLLPVGKWTAMEENTKGLKVDGELFALGTEKGQYIYEGLKSGALDGLSIGYRVKEFTQGTKPSEPRRTLKSLDLMELSIVTFPMNDKARVGAVKSFDAVFWRALEEELRTDRKLNLSNASAVSVVAILKKHLREGGELTTDLSREADEAALVAIINRNIESITLSR